MKTSFYERIGGGVHVLAADLIEMPETSRPPGYGSTGNLYLLTRINVPEAHRGNRLGSRLLKMVTDEADANQATLILEVVPSGPLSSASLQEWYERNGFHRYSPIPGVWGTSLTPAMIRIPNRVRSAP